MVGTYVMCGTEISKAGCIFYVEDLRDAFDEASTGPQPWRSCDRGRTEGMPEFVRRVGLDL
jgi:hypothetical protein